jgi:hypothetical protein
MITFNYALTTEEEVALNDWLVDYNAKAKHSEQTTIQLELEKPIKKFLTLLIQRKEGKHLDKLGASYKNAEKSKKDAVDAILGL